MTVKKQKKINFINNCNAIVDYEDLENALINNDMEATRENIEKLKVQCLNIFDDKTIRNEMLEETARLIKKGNIK